jgi:hypothetical protein
MKRRTSFADDVGLGSKADHGEGRLSTRLGALVACLALVPDCQPQLSDWWTVLSLAGEHNTQPTIVNLKQD